MKNKFNEIYENFKTQTITEEIKPTAEMVDWFKSRTDKHIKSVQDNWRKLYDSKFSKYLDELDDKEEHILKHDASKYKEPEYTPYLFITWKYKQEADGKTYEIPEDMVQKATAATTHHVFNNSHHPVYWDTSKKPEDNVINDKDRDKATGEIVDGTSMPNWAICEMISDWSAVSLERKSSLKGWADMNVGADKRWDFTETQTKLIYQLVDFFEKDL